MIEAASTSYGDVNQKSLPERKVKRKNPYSCCRTKKKKFSSFHPKRTHREREREVRYENLIGLSSSDNALRFTYPQSFQEGKLFLRSFSDRMQHSFSVFAVDVLCDQLNWGRLASVVFSAFGM